MNSKNLDFEGFIQSDGAFYRISVPPAAVRPPSSTVGAAKNCCLSRLAGCPEVALEVVKAEESKELVMFDATLTQSCLAETNRVLQMRDGISTITSEERKNNFNFCIAINQIYAMVYIFQ